MQKKFWIAYTLAVVMLATCGIAQSYKRHFHIHQTSLTTGVVTCDNGAKPVVGESTATELEFSCSPVDGRH